MTGKIITIVNRKGGVGKTTLVLALTEALLDSIDPDERKSAAIVVDLDPQASLTTALMNVPDPGQRLEKLAAMSRSRRAIHHVISDRVNGDFSAKADDIRFAGCGLTNLTYSMIGNDSDGWQAELDLILEKHPPEKIRETVRGFIGELGNQFRYVVVDCPPGQTLFAEGALQASDLVLCPLTPDRLAYWGMESFENHLAELRKARRLTAKIFWIVTKYNHRAGTSNQQTIVLNELNDRDEPVFELLKEAGENDPVKQLVSLPYDSKIADRLKGAPRPNKPWTFEKAYRKEVRKSLSRLARTVKMELKDG